MEALILPSLQLLDQIAGTNIIYLNMSSCYKYNYVIHDIWGGHDFEREKGDRENEEIDRGRGREGEGGI